MQYLSRAERHIVRKFVADVLAAGYTLDVNDGTALVVHRTRTVQTVLSAIGTTGGDFLIVRDGGDRRIGWVHFVWGNDEDCIADHTDNETMRNLLARAERAAETVGYLDAVGRW